MSGPFVLVRSTYGEEAAARAAARRLVAAGEACCAHVTRIDSMYVWEGKLIEEAEWMLEARVLNEAAPAVAMAIADGHPYEEPLVECIPVQWAAPGYVAWARQGHKAG